MMFKVKTVLILILVFVFSYFLITQVVASNCPATDYDCQIKEIQNEINALTPAHEKNKEELASLRAKITDLNKRITSLTGQIAKTETEIKKREEELGFTKAVFEEKTQNHYRFIRLYDPILPFLSTKDATQAFREANLRQKAADEDRKLIEKYASDLIKLKNDKDNLEKNKTSLAQVKVQVSEKEKFMAGEVGKVENYLTTLSAKQQELQALKEGGFSTSVGDTPATLEPCSGPLG